MTRAGRRLGPPDGDDGPEAFGVATVGADGRIVSADEPFAGLVGMPVVGRYLEDLVLDNQRDLARRIVTATSDDWAEAFVALRPDALGVPVDHVVRYRRAADEITVVIQPAADATASVSRALLALVDDLVESRRRLEARTRELEAAMEEIRSTRLVLRKLEGILPVCMSCGRVRTDDDREWVEAATYLLRSGVVAASHGYCPACERDAMRTLASTDERDGPSDR